MKAAVRKFKTVYKTSLEESLAGGGEVVLQRGYELGRHAVRDGIGVMDIISIHAEVVLSLLSQAATTSECTHIVKASQCLLSEFLAPFELTYRGFIDLESLTVQLETANKELESFSYTVSHDLRTPLLVIDWYMRVILEKCGDTFDEDMLAKLNVVRSQAQMMSKLIDDLLAFSCLGKKNIAPSKLDIGEIVNEVWRELLVVNSKRKMGMTLKSVPIAYGDRTLIKQVYFNLLSNAVKFTKRSTDARIEAGGFIEGDKTVFFVKDNGIGFDMAYHDKLFGVFQRLHSSSDFDGTGIGLATVQRIVHRHGGRVWAKGKEGKGATFFFSLPLSHTR
jgi:light-regulated signal transduction histidine kinase (bacteriophytochrome)